MMSTAKEFRIHYDFGYHIHLLDYKVTAFLISDAAAIPIDVTPVSVGSSEFLLNLPYAEGNYYYVIVKVLQYLVEKSGDIYTVDPSANVEYVTIFRWDDTDIAIGSPSTVAGVYAFAQRIAAGNGSSLSIACSKDFREVAYAMKNNLCSTVGGVSPVLLGAPNKMQTNALAVFNFLSNLLYYSLADFTVYRSFLDCVNTIPGVDAASSLDAILAVAQHPFDNVNAVYALIKDKYEVFRPSLKQIEEAGMNPVPDQWTLAVKVNRSGSENFLISGTAYTVFDKDNKAWVTNNFRQGTPNSGSHCLVFNPDGSPAAISPIMGGGILGPGFGVAVNPAGDTIAFGNYGWGSKDYNPVKGSISVFASDGAVISPPNGFTNGICRVQGMCYDAEGNLWMASWGSQAPMEDPTGPHIYDVPSEFSAVVCYIGGDPERALVYNDFGSGPSENHGTFGVVIDKQGNCIVSNAGTAGVMPSSVYKVRISAGKDKLEYVAHWNSNWVSKRAEQIPGFEEFRQPQLDSEGKVYVGGITSGRVVKLHGETLLQEDEFFDNIYGPWGITIDSKNKKFITGFGQRKKVTGTDATKTLEGTFGITVVNAGDKSWTQSRLMTLPSGGEEVTLANGQPLYGNQLDKDGNPMPPSYQPLMRVTSTAVDRAGNLWCANNWKPSIYADVKAESPNPNPGGDGMVIFIGVAEPLAPIKKVKG